MYIYFKNIDEDTFVYLYYIWCCEMLNWNLIFWRQKTPSEMLKHRPILLEDYRTKPFKSDPSNNGSERPFQKDELCLSL